VRGLLTGHLQRQAPDLFLWRLPLSRESPFPSRFHGSRRALSRFSGETPGYAMVCILPLSLSSTFVSLLDPTVPPVLSLTGAVRSAWAGRTALDFEFQAPFRSRKLAFLFTVPRAINQCARVTRITQSSSWVSSGILISPVRVELLSQSFAGPDRTPKFNATWSGSTLLDNPGATFAPSFPARLPSGIPLDLSS